MKYHKLVENAVKPEGFWGKLMIRSMNKGHSDLTDWALCHVTVQPDDVILDVGCGGGKTVDKLCKRISNGKVYGVDYSELCVKKSESLNHKNVICGKARILQASVSELPFEDDKFNLVTAIETYYFWPDKPGDLKEIFRTLAPGGKLMLAFEMVRDSENLDKWKSVEDRLGIKDHVVSGVKEIAGKYGITHDKNELNALLKREYERSIGYLRDNLDG